MNYISIPIFRLTAICALALSISACASPFGRAQTATSVVSQGIDPAANGLLVDEYKSASGKQCQRYSQTTTGKILVQCREEGGAWQNAKSLDGIYTEGYLKMVQTNNVRKLNSVEHESEIRSDSALVDDVSSDFVIDEAMSGSVAHGSYPSPEGDRLAAAIQTDAPIEVEVESGESLWDLAARITGSGNNWVAIAKANDLQDANRIRSGQVLLVPQSVIQLK